MTTKKNCPMLNKLYSALLGILMILSFQNCAFKNVFQGSSTSSEMTSGGGSGHSYDGKIYVVSGKCDDGTVTVARITLISETSATLTRENCTDIAPRVLGAGEFSIDPKSPTQLVYNGLTFVLETAPVPPVLLSKAYFQWNNQTLALTQPATYFVSWKNYSGSEIQALKANGHTVICAITAGVANSLYDYDFADFPPETRGNISSGSEHWLDTRSTTVRALMMKRLDRAQNLGCHGIMWDQTDAWLNSSGFPLTADTQLDYIRFLASAVRNRRMLVSLANTNILVNDVVGLFDMQFSQDCYKSNICDDYLPFVNAGKPVYIADDRPFSQALCDQARASGFTLWFTTPTQDGTRHEPCP